MGAVNLILGDQLFADISALPPGPVVMVEDLDLARHYRYHTYKLVLTFAAMREFAARHPGRVHYFPLEARTSIPQALAQTLQATQAQEVHTYEPADAFFARQLRTWAQTQGITLKEHPNPMFLTPAEEWQNYRAHHKRLLMADFYKRQRRRLGILLDDHQEPLGGQWSYDTENRKPLPKSLQPPAVMPPALTPITREVIALVKNHFPEAAGDPATFAFPVTSAQAEDWLADFLEHRLDLFGDYEDALPSQERTVFHSLLTPMLNIGLLTPAQVIEATLARHARRPVPLNSLEGFIRQIIGWREFVRGIAREEPAVQRTFPHHRRLTPAWEKAATGLPPVDRSLARARDHGWCHHIERLMVIGAVMFMCEVDPEEVYRYFMEMFVDASEWVMGPNVFGMSQCASAGAFATKPYFSGSAYIRRMSGEPAGPWCDVWDGLYWRTIARNREFFAQNQRMSQAVRGYERLEPTRRDRILAAAEGFIESVTVAG